MTADLDWRDKMQGAGRLGQHGRPASLVVIATGPRSNGTRLLSRILDTADRYGPGSIHPIHFPVYPPEQVDFVAEFPNALFVVIQRDEWAAANSMVEAGYHRTLSDAQREQGDAEDILHDLLWTARSRAHRIAYEDLVRDPEYGRRSLDRFLRGHGYTGRPLTLPERIYDGNAKYAVAA